MADAPYRGSAMKRGGRAKAEALIRRTGYEGSPADIAEDRRGAKKLGVSLGAYERTGRDRREDAAGSKRKRRAEGGAVDADADDDGKGFKSYIEPLAKTLTDPKADFRPGGAAGFTLRQLLGPKAYETAGSGPYHEPAPIPSMPRMSSGASGASDIPGAASDAYKRRGASDIPTDPNYGQYVDQKRRRQGTAKGGKVGGRKP